MIVERERKKNNVGMWLDSLDDKNKEEQWPIYMGGGDLNQLTNNKTIESKGTLTPQP